MYIAELRDASATELVAGYAAGEYSPLEVTEHALAVIEMTNSHVNAMFQVEAEAARDAAHSSTERWAAGTPASALDGVPTVVKDGLDAIGWPNNRGSACEQQRACLDRIELHQALGRQLVGIGVDLLRTGGQRQSKRGDHEHRGGETKSGEYGGGATESGEHESTINRCARRHNGEGPPSAADNVISLCGNTAMQPRHRPTSSFGAWLSTPTR